MDAEDIRFYYWRDDQRAPRITLCRLVRHGITAYGWAIAATDMPCYADGRLIAWQRAVWAMGKAGKYVDECTDRRAWGRPILRQEAVHAVHACGAYALLALSDASETVSLPQSMQPPESLQRTYGALPPPESSYQLGDSA